MRSKHSYRSVNKFSWVNKAILKLIRESFQKVERNLDEIKQDVWSFIMMTDLIIIMLSKLETTQKHWREERYHRN
jgi:hypothetical protein